MSKQSLERYAQRFLYPFHGLTLHGVSKQTIVNHILEYLKPSNNSHGCPAGLSENTTVSDADCQKQRRLSRLHEKFIYLVGWVNCGRFKRATVVGAFYRRRSP